MDKELKKSIIITAALVLILIIILLIPGRKVAVNIISLVVIIILVALVWVRHLKCPILKKGGAEEVVEKVEDDELATRTGRPCEKSGTYVCSVHPDRSVEMEVGKRFPPCQGDGGHSAIWELQG
ncbi:MAG: hypothetical protein GX842_05550 [Spirochaetales bacterium]|jgi:hypothetical protein|nr:hypothetical protein [Spirochaetales bacterium]